MKPTLPIGSVLLVGLALWACTDSNLIAGNTTQTENTFAARVLRVDSVLPGWNPAAGMATVATLRFDSTNFPFSSSDSSGRDLVVERQDGHPVAFEVVYWDLPARLGRLRVRIDSTLLRPRARFVVRWRQPLQTRSNPTAVWNSIPDSQKLSLGSVLVDNFEAATDTTLLPTRPVWGTFITGASTVSPIGFPAAGGTRPGKAMTVDYHIDSNSYVVVKTPLVRNQGARSIRGLDSLVFWAKGTKDLHVFVAFDHADLFKTWVLDTLDTAWTRIRIRPSDLISANNPNGGNRGWEAVRDSATHLTFILTTGTHFQVDDIRLYGIDRDDLK